MFVDVDNLGDEALFLCECGSMSVLASNLLGCKSNSIYYIESGYYSLSSCNDLNIIDLQDGSVRTLFSFNEPPITRDSMILHSYSKVYYYFIDRFAYTYIVSCTQHVVLNLNIIISLSISLLIYI